MISEKGCYKMYRCRRCGANCDCGELINDTCIDCLEEEKQEQLSNSKVVSIINAPFHQMTLEEFLK